VSDTLGARTIRDFGEQWTRYTENAGYYGSVALLADLLEPLLTPAELAGARVAEIGSGTGRIVRMLAEAGAAHIVAVEPSEAVAVLRQNTADIAERVTYVEAPGDRMPAAGDLDYVLSIGVLHHIPEPEPVVARAFAALRPGGRLVAWLYGREGNGLYLAVAEPLRAVTRRLPHAVLAPLCRGLDGLLVGYMALCRVAPLPLRRYMRDHLARLSPEARRLTIYDQLNPAFARYYRKGEVRALVEGAGFVDVRLHHRHGYSWTVVARKPG
jgi:SAM-dependent methyltransferase